MVLQVQTLIPPSTHGEARTGSYKQGSIKVKPVYSATLHRHANATKMFNFKLVDIFQLLRRSIINENLLLGANRSSGFTLQWCISAVGEFPLFKCRLSL